MEKSLVDRYLQSTANLTHEEKMAVCKFYFYLLDLHMIKVSDLLALDESEGVKDV